MKSAQTPYSVMCTNSSGTSRVRRTEPETLPPVFCFLPFTTANTGHSQWSPSISISASYSRRRDRLGLAL